MPQREFRYASIRAPRRERVFRYAPPTSAVRLVETTVDDVVESEVDRLVVSEADLPALVNIRDVELITVGHIEASTGPVDLTQEDLAQVIEASQDPGVRTPIIKLGHLDPRWNNAQNPYLYDGCPSIGRIENIRLSEDKMTILGDFIGVPAWLAKVMPYAYPSRSVEMIGPVETMTEHKHDRVLTAIALLGEATPAVQTLEDIQVLFGSEVPDYVYAAIENVTVASTKGGKRMPAEASVRASVNVEDVRRQFYESQPQGSWAWIREMWSDFLIVDDDTGQLWKVPWSESSGDVSFGEPQAVKVEYVDTEADEGATLEVAATAGIAASAATPILLSRYAADEQSHDHVVTTQAGADAATETPAAPESPSTAEADAPVVDQSNKEQGMTDAELRAAIGLPEDATDEQVQERLSQLPPVDAGDGGDGGDGGEGADGGDGGDGGDGADGTGEAEGGEGGEGGEATTVTKTTTKVAAAAAQLPPGMRVIDESTLSELLAAANMGREARQRQLTEDRDRVLAGAMAEGRFAPARLDHYRKAWDVDPEGTRELVTKTLAAGLVPVEAQGHGGEPPEDALDAELDAFSASMFPELADLENRS